MKEVTKVTDVPSANPLSKAPTNEELQRDCGYYKAQEVLKSLLEGKLITKKEYKEITLLNRKTFAPFLVEIFPEIRC